MTFILTKNPQALSSTCIDNDVTTYSINSNSIYSPTCKLILKQDDPSWPWMTLDLNLTLPHSSLVVSSWPPLLWCWRRCCYPLHPVHQLTRSYASPKSVRWRHRAWMWAPPQDTNLPMTIHNSKVLWTNLTFHYTNEEFS